MTREQAEQYLLRIGITRTPQATLQGLTELHNRHLLSVPFENIDVHYKRPVSLLPGDLFAKIVTRYRGGFCYELNGLFAGLLSALGFTVTLHSARVFNAKGERGPEFDHLMLLVTLPEGKFLCDVGFGDFIFSPLPFVTGKVVTDSCGSFIIKALPEGEYCIYKQGPTGEEPQYTFTRTQYELQRFSGMCVYHSTSPLSHFTRNAVATLLTEHGRITVHGSGVKITAGDTVKEIHFSGDDELRRALKLYLGLEHF